MKKKQFSKKITAFCITNLIIIEIFTMILIWITKDMETLGLLITSVAAQCLGCVIWYMKNSATEKKSLIEAGLYDSGEYENDEDMEESEDLEDSEEGV